MQDLVTLQTPPGLHLTGEESVAMGPRGGLQFVIFLQHVFSRVP